MAWERKPNDFEMIEDAEEKVREVYGDYRKRGLSASDALAGTARVFGFTERHVRSFLEGYTCALAIEQWRDMRLRFMAHLDDEAAHALKRAANRSERRARMERENAELREMRR